MTTRYFIESDFDSPQRARQARDELAQHLTSQELHYRSLTLLRATDGIKVFSELLPNILVYGKKVFPSCRREDSPDLIVQFDLDDDNSYAIVCFGEKQLFGNKKMSKVETVASVSDLQKRFDQDHRKAMESLDD